MKKLSSKPSKPKLTKQSNDTKKEPDSKLDYFTKKLIRQKIQNREYQREHYNRVFKRKGTYAQVERILLGAKELKS